MCDCIIVGGGLIGMLSARELAREGLRVRLIERSRVGQESSWAGGGILSPLYPWRFDDAVTRLASWSQARYAELAGALREESGIDSEWLPSGLLTLDETEIPAAEQWAIEHKVPLDVVDQAQIREIEPALSHAPAHATWLAQVGQIRNPRLVKALQVSIQRAGVSVEQESEVRGLILRGGRVAGVETNEGPRHSDSVVVCSGAWSARLLEQAGVRLEVAPVRGQMLLLRGHPGLLGRILLQQERYLIPRRDGRILVGSTMEYVGFLKKTTDKALDELRATAQRLLPATQDLPVEHHWAGLRPGSPQGIPYIGQVGATQGLFVNAGHFRNGVVLAPASARLLRNLLLGEPPIVDPEPYAVAGDTRSIGSSA